MYWKGETTSLAFYGGNITCFYEDDPETVRGLDNIMYYSAVIKVIVGDKSFELFQDDSLFLLELARVLEDIHKNPKYSYDDHVGDSIYNYSFATNLRTLNTFDYDVDIISNKAYNTSIDTEDTLYHRLHVYEGLANEGFSCTFIIFDEEIPSLVKAIYDFTNSVLAIDPTKDSVKPKPQLPVTVKTGLVQEIRLSNEDIYKSYSTILGEIIKNGSSYIIRGFKIKDTSISSEHDEYEHYEEIVLDSTDTILCSSKVVVKKEVLYHKMRANALATELTLLKKPKHYAPKRQLKG